MRRTLPSASALARVPVPGERAIPEPGSAALPVAGTPLTDRLPLVAARSSVPRGIGRSVARHRVVDGLRRRHVLKTIEVTPLAGEEHFFWSGTGKLDSIVRSWQTRLHRLFDLAKVEDGHAHRFRDTFAVELLLSGVPIERVSILLGHTSVRIAASFLRRNTTHRGYVQGRNSWKPI